MISPARSSALSRSGWQEWPLSTHSGHSQRPALPHSLRTIHLALMELCAKGAGRENLHSSSAATGSFPAKIKVIGTCAPETAITCQTQCSLSDAILAPQRTRISNAEVKSKEKLRDVA